MGGGAGGSGIHRPRPVSFSSLPQHTQSKLGDTAILLSRHRPPPGIRETTGGTIFTEARKTQVLPAVWVQEVSGKGEFSPIGFPRVLNLQNLLVIQSTAPVLRRFRFLEQQASRHDAGPHSS